MKRTYQTKVQKKSEEEEKKKEKLENIKRQPMTIRDANSKT